MSPDGGGSRTPSPLPSAVGLQDHRTIDEVRARSAGYHVGPAASTGPVRGTPMPAASSAAYCRALLISRSRARGPFTTPPTRCRVSQASTPGGQFGGIAVPTRVRGGAHAVVEHALGRWGGEVEDARPTGPMLPKADRRWSKASERGGNQAGFSWIT